MDVFNYFQEKSTAGNDILCPNKIEYFISKPNERYKILKKLTFTETCITSLTICQYRRTSIL